MLNVFLKLILFYKGITTITTTVYDFKQTFWNVVVRLLISLSERQRLYYDCFCQQ